MSKPFWHLSGNDLVLTHLALGFPSCSVVKNPPVNNARGAGSIPGSGRSPGGGNGNLLQYACLGNPMDEETGWLHGVAKSWTQLSD